MKKTSAKSRERTPQDGSTTNLGLELGLDQEMHDLFRATQTPEELEAELEGIKRLVERSSSAKAQPSEPQSTPQGERTLDDLTPDELEFLKAMGLQR